MFVYYRIISGVETKEDAEVWEGRKHAQVGSFLVRDG